MLDQIQDYLRRIWKSFQAFSPGQKAVTIVAALTVIIGGFLFSQWAARPSYSPLFTNLEPADASAIVDKLNSAGVPYKLVAGGTEIDVPQDSLYEQRLAMSSAGLPSSGSTGYSLLDKEGVTTSQFKQQVDYQRAVEGELSSTIRSISGVQAATVHLAIPQQDVFNDGTVRTTASVLVTTGSGNTLSGGQVQSIVNLVANSVPGLSSKDVTVADSTGKVLSTGDGTDAATSTDSQDNATKDYNSRLSSSLQAMLDRVVGPGHSSVVANAALNFDKTDSTKKEYVYTQGIPPLSEATTNETYTGTGANTGGILGSSDNAASNTTGSTSGNGSYTKTTDTKDNPVGTQETNTVAAPGSVKKLAVAVVLDSNVANVDKTAITNLVTSAAGLDTQRGDSLAIESMAFDTKASEQAAQASAAAQEAAKKAESQKQTMEMLRYGGLAVLVLAVLIGTWIASRRRRKMAAMAPDRTPDEIDDLIAALQHQNPAGDVIHEPSPPVVNAAAEELANQRRVLIQLAENEPQDVARVMRSWLTSNN